MPSAASPNPHAPPQDDLDALFDFDAGIDEAVNSADREFNTGGIDRAVEHTSDVQTSNVDEDVVVTKRRQPIAKLDEARILAANGIPRLQKISKSMRFKGKGHEFSDIAKVLQMYQIWLDDLYPRAKFADGLALIEKLGHKKTMQVMRKSWIDEGKPRRSDVGDDDEQTASASRPTPPDRSVEGVASTGLQEDADDTAPAGSETTAPAKTIGLLPSLTAPTEQDELDILMAEEGETGRPPMHDHDHDAFADEEEAMAGMDW